MQSPDPRRPKLVEICRKCGKTIGRGSMTAWIFNGKGGCTCITGGTSDAVTTDSKKAKVTQSKDRVLDLRVSRTTGQPELSKNHPDLSGDGVVIASRYKLDELVGIGGMGSVYRATEQSLDKTFAVKLLRADLVLDNAAVRRFEREARAVSSLTHPNLVAIYDFGFADGQPYLVMDYLDGLGLDKLISQNIYLESPRVVSLFVQAVDAIAHAHAKRIVHRDIKPSNIIVIGSTDGQEFVKIVDFGIAKILPEGDNLKVAGKSTQNLTQTGEVFGSPYYMSPEQCLGGKIDGRSDIYSIGCVMYETLCGSPPFKAENPIQTILQHINEPPKDLCQHYSQLAIADDLDYLVMRCLEKHPDDRYQSANELKSDLDRLASGKALERVEAKKRKLEFKTQKVGLWGTANHQHAVGLAVAIVGVMVVSGVALRSSLETDTGKSANSWANLDFLGQEAFNRGDLKNARGYFDEALTQAESSSKTAGASPAHLEASLNELLDLSRATGKTQDEQLLLARLSSIKSEDADHAKSIGQKLDQAIATLAMPVADVSSLVDRANDSIGSLIEGEHFDLAKALLNKVSKLLERVGSDSVAAIRYHHNAAYLDHDLGKYDQARKQYKETLAMERNNLRAGHPFIAQTLLMMAQLGMQDGKDSRADIDRWLNEALSIYQTEGRREQMALVRYHRGRYHEWLGQKKEGIDEVEAALTIYRNLKDVDPKYLARCYSLLGRMAGDTENIKQAIELYEHRPLKDYRFLVSALQDYAAAEEADNPELAEHLSQRAYAVSWRLEPKNRAVQQAEIQARLANLYRKKGEYDAAIASEKNVLELSRTAYGADSYPAFQSLVTLGALCDDAGDVKAASAHLDSAHEMFQKNRVKFANSQAASEFLSRYKLILTKTGRAKESEG